VVFITIQLQCVEPAKVLASVARTEGRVLESCSLCRDGRVTSSQGVARVSPGQSSDRHVSG
jgi:hypothetical protein